MVKHHCFFAFCDEFVVQDVEHLEERGFVCDFVDHMGFEIALCCRTSLTPNAQCDVLEVIAHL